jgi:hypothetical protein
VRADSGEAIAQGQLIPISGKPKSKYWSIAMSRFRLVEVTLVSHNERMLLNIDHIVSAQIEKNDGKINTVVKMSDGQTFHISDQFDYLTRYANTQ